MNKYNFVCLLIAFIVNVQGETDELCAMFKRRRRCVPLSDCDHYSLMIRNSSTAERGLWLVQSHWCGYGDNEALVCCPITRRSKKKPKVISRSPAVDTGRPVVDLASPMLDPRNQDQDFDDLIDELPKPPHCGVRGFLQYQRTPDCKNIIMTPALLNGKPAYTGITRWMALLGYQAGEVTWRCAGTVISNRHVLTAAHCIKPELYVIRLGEMDYALQGELGETVTDYLIKRAIRHEHYTRFHNDIGILVTKETIVFTEHVRPICLPVPNFPKEELSFSIFTSENAMVEGWGVTENGTTSSKLLYTYLDKLDNSVCRDMYKRHNVSVDERVICAGASGADACEGDSGGPLVGLYCPLDKKLHAQNDFLTMEFYYSIGIVSYGFKCSKSQYAAVYTNVEYFMPWIMSKVVRLRL